MARAICYAALMAFGLYNVVSFDTFENAPIVLILIGAAGYVGWQTRY